MWLVSLDTGFLLAAANEGDAISEAERRIVQAIQDGTAEFEVEEIFTILERRPDDAVARRRDMGGGCGARSGHRAGADELPPLVPRPEHGDPEAETETQTRRRRDDERHD
jgi:hypothetical protein